MHITGRNIFLAWILLMAAVAVIGGMMLSGSPSQERARRFDQQRVTDLQSIVSAMDQVFNNPTDGGKLPEKLEDLRQRRDIYVNSIADPKTSQLYEYHVTTADAYQLCAEFEADSPPTDAQTRPQAIYPKVDSGTDFWNHPAGHKCFDVKVQHFQKP